MIDVKLKYMLSNQCNTFQMYLAFQKKCGRENPYIVFNKKPNLRPSGLNTGWQGCTSTSQTKLTSFLHLKLNE
jgi:hypothetical protein